MGLLQDVEAMGPCAPNSAKSLVEVFHYLGVVVVQDALDVGDKYPDNPVHAYLDQHPDFE